MPSGARRQIDAVCHRSRKGGSQALGGPAAGPREEQGMVFCPYFWGGRFPAEACSMMRSATSPAGTT